MSIFPEHTRGLLRTFCRDPHVAEFGWTISGLLEAGVYTSPPFTCWYTDWILGVCKDRGDEHTVFVSRTFRAYKTTRRSDGFTIRIETPDGERTEVARDRTLDEDETTRSFRVPGWRWGSTEFTIRCTLWRERSPHTEGVSLEKEAEDAAGLDCDSQMEVFTSLSEHFKKLLLSGDGHDVLFKVKDKQFSAHKHILKVRSPVFAAMFRHDMAESADGSVTIEDCDPDTFGQFLHFVYSGKADFASVGMALGLYYAGDKYDFPSLKKICLEFLMNSMTTTTVFEVVHLAAKHGEEEVLRRAIVYFAENLEEVMLTEEWRRFLSTHPVEANEMSLKAVQCLKTFFHKK